METINNVQTFCWWCGKKLRLPNFAVTIDPIGNVHKVHVGCRSEVIDDMKPEPMFAQSDDQQVVFRKPQ